MIRMAKEDEKMVTKILRIICWAVLIAGWVMLFSIFSTILHTLPILGKLGDFAIFLVAFIIGTVCCCGVTAVAYIRYRPLLAFGIIAVASAIAAIVFVAIDENSDTDQPTLAPTPPPVMAPAVASKAFPSVFDAMEYY